VLTGFWPKVGWLWQEPLPSPVRTVAEIAGVDRQLLEAFEFDPPYRHNARERLLALLLTNEGLARAVRLAPLERWREALKQVYGSW
jgi:hypothetical protein